MSAAARLDLRLTRKDKTRIERAAGLRGMPVAAFVREAVLSEADHVMESSSGATPGRSPGWRGAVAERDRFGSARGIAQVKWRTDELMALLRKPDRA